MPGVTERGLPATTGTATAGDAASAGDAGHLLRLEIRVIVLAAVAWLGADLGFRSLHNRLTLIVSLLFVLIGLGRRSFVVLAIGVFGLLSYLGAAAELAYRPLSPGPLDAEVTIVGDPRPAGAGWRVDVKLPDGSRVEARAYGPVGWDLSEVLVGEVHRIVGRVRAPGASDWFRVRHISGRASVDQIVPVRDPGARWVVPEFVRGLVVGGTTTMTDRQRALYLGLVIGDDRFQPLGQRLNFRAAGLTHLLAVSGQNVAFVLAVVRGPLRLLGRRSRLVATVGVLVVFAVMTRMEPSVLRATASALLAVWASATGRERSGLIILSVAVMAVLCIDPFLVDSVGFQLSVAASIGILILGPMIERRLPGPAWVAGPLATTLSAQIGVAPVLSVYFGPVSVASIPANLAAGWAAAAVMTLGLTVGTVAGLVPDQLAALLQLPTTALLEWLEVVARFSARLSVPRFGAVGLSALTGAALMAGPRLPSTTEQPWHPRSAQLRLFAVVTAFGLLLASWPSPPETSGGCGEGMTWFPGGQSGQSVLVIGSDAFAGSIEDCLDRGIRSAEVVIAERGGRRTAEIVAASREVMDVGRIVAPPQHRIIGASRLLQTQTIKTGNQTVVVTAVDRTLLSVEVRHGVGD